MSRPPDLGNFWMKSMNIYIHACLGTGKGFSKPGDAVLFVLQR